MRRHYLVRGRVQGVGYRYFAWRHGRRLGLAGWVRNLPDGRVEALADAAPDRLEQFEAELRRGPALASVQALDIAEPQDESEPLGTFEIR